MGKARGRGGRTRGRERFCAAIAQITVAAPRNLGSETAAAPFEGWSLFWGGRDERTLTLITLGTGREGGRVVAPLVLKV